MNFYEDVFRYLSQPWHAHPVLREFSLQRRIPRDYPLCHYDWRCTNIFPVPLPSGTGLEQDDRMVGSARPKQSNLRTSNLRSMRTTGRVDDLWLTRAGGLGTIGSARMGLC